MSKVRHIDVNVLWLQEVCARKMIPVHKVPGEQNPADLTTKHLTSILIDKNIRRMHMKFQEGRASEAAQLHALNGRPEHKESEMSNEDAGIDRAMMSIGQKTSESWSRIRAAANDARGGDRWKTRGAGGIWHRWHVTPRRTLFTPFRVAKGPGKDVPMKHNRLTVGITKDGEHFEVVDDWSLPKNSHRKIDTPWIGYTVFAEEREDVRDLHQERTQMKWLSRNCRWADDGESDQ